MRHSPICRYLLIDPWPDFFRPFSRLQSCFADPSDLLLATEATWLFLLSSLIRGAHGLKLATRATFVYVTSRYTCLTGGKHERARHVLEEETLSYHCAIPSASLIFIFNCESRCLFDSSLSKTLFTFAVKLIY